MKIHTNPYEIAGEAEAQRILKEISAVLDKKGDLQLFQLDMLLSLLKNQIAPLVVGAGAATIIFAYEAMKKLLENMKNSKMKAQQEYEQDQYSYGFPMSDEFNEDPSAFDFYRR